MLFAIAIAPVFGEIQVSNWEYSSDYNKNWLSENFSSTWLSGNAPFGDPDYFTVNTSADYKHIYARKIISLNDSTQGIIKVKAENNLKCYANGNLVVERYGFIQKGNQFYNCYLEYFSDSCSTGTKYYYGDYNDQNDFVYVDVSKYLKKGDNVIACEAWVDSNAYYYKYNTYYKKYIDGRLYLDLNCLVLDSDAVLWSKTDTNFYKPETVTTIYQTFTCGTYGCGSGTTTNAIVKTEYWVGPWQFGSLPVSDESYFKWTNLKCQPGGGSCKYIDPIWPYDSTNLYLRKWIWSDSDEIKTLQISDTKLPDCYVNGIKINLTSFNSLYWKYTSDVSLVKGQNLIACKSPTINVNSFDMRIVNVNGKLAIVSIVNDSEIRAGSETIFTVTLANDSHPETHVALTLEAWGQMEYKQLLTETNSGTAKFKFTPAEAGNYDLLITALDLYDNDVATFSIKVDAAVACNEQYGFFPLSGNSDAKGGDGNLLVAALVATLGGAAAAGIYAFKGTSQGFSSSRIENSLNRASKAMNTLSYVANANAQANQNSFLATMAQRFNDFKAKFSAIEDEKQKIKEEEEERARRIKEIDAKNVALSYKPPEEKPMTWAEWYAQQGMPMPDHRNNPVIFSSSWSAIEAEKEGKAIRKEAKEKYGIKTSSINELINMLKKPEPVQMGFGQGIVSAISNFSKKENGETLTKVGEGIKFGSSVAGLVSIGMLVAGIALSFTGVGAVAGVPLISAGLTGLAASYGFYLGGYTAGVFGHAITANNIESESDLNKSKENLKSDIIEGAINLATIGVGGIIIKAVGPRIITYLASSSYGTNVLRGIGFSDDVLNICKFDKEIVMSREEIGGPAATAMSENTKITINKNGETIVDKVDLIIADKLTPDETKNFWIIKAHEQFGENAVWKGLIKWPSETEVKPYLNGLSYEQFKESLGADVITSRIIGKDTMINGRMLLDPNGRNWWVDDPLLVKLVDGSTATWYTSPTTGQIIVGGSQTINSINGIVGGNNN